MWPFLTLLALAALLALHLAWRARFRRARQAARLEIEQLREQQERTRFQIQQQQEVLFDSMAEGLLLLDEHGKIQLANRAFTALFGVTSDVRSRTIIEALRLHELADLAASLQTQEQILGYELKVPAPRERWLQVNGAAVFGPDGRKHGSILVFHDLTRLKQLESARQEFVANVSHELRTPLSLITGYIETLLDGASNAPQLAERFLQIVNRNARRLHLLIEDLLTISELESGRLKLELQDVPLNPAIGKVLEEYKGRADVRQIRLLNTTPNLHVRADPNRLEQVLGNLIDNAIKYGRKDGQVIVGAQVAEGGQVEVFVQDDGPGIPAESLERLFERFYRVDKARSREQGGTGLGLSIVKHIVQNHGGRVWARSEPGHGATFYFTLPQEHRTRN